MTDNNSNNNDNKDQQEETLPVYQLADDSIAIIRELVQLSILTGTNIVDHLRALQVEPEKESGKLIPTIAYVESYNAMIEELSRRAEEEQKALDKQIEDAAKFEMNEEEDPEADSDLDLELSKDELN